MFKPQSAHWESLLDGAGVAVLRKLVAHIHARWPGMPVFLDCKRGDIARTQQQYRVAHLDILGADGMNFSPYMGKDCMAALVDKKNLGRALVGLCYTSDPDAGRCRTFGFLLQGLKFRGVGFGNILQNGFFNGPKSLALLKTPGW